MVEDSLNKLIYFYDYCGNYVSWSQGSTTPPEPPEPDTFNVTLPVSNPEPGEYFAWTATESSKVIRFLARREGGIGATVNVLKNGVQLLVTDLSLSIEEAWLEGAPLTSDSFAPGDTLSFEITDSTGDIDLITFSMEFEQDV